MATVRLSRSATIGGSTIGGVVQTRTDAPTSLEYDETFAAAVTNQDLGLDFLIAQMKAVAIEADKACTLKTNNATTPAQTITLAANVPIIWSLGDTAANPFTANVTAMFLTAATAGTRLRFAVALDTSA